MAAKRPYGSGSLFEHRGAWYGQWRDGGRLVKRKLGPIKGAGSRDGLTRPQAERELHRMMVEVRPAPPRERATVADLGERYIRHLEVLGRKRSTTGEYRSYLRVHLAPAFGMPLAKIDRAAVEAFTATQRRKGLAPKSIRLHLSLLHGIFEYAIREGMASVNPVKAAAKPVADADTDIRFLDDAELRALLAAIPDDKLGSVERPLYLTAAMTGLRQGELLGLRWRDVDWLAMRVRVRQNYVRGEMSTPKSRRGSRSVPLASPVAAELEALSRRSAYTADDDLVFCHPDTGNPFDRSRLLKRFKAALKRAGVREVRFHDLRHTFGTRMAAAGVAMRTLQEWLGHRDFKTTLIYADYAPGEHEAELVERAFAGHQSGHQSSHNSTPVEVTRAA